MRLRLERIPEYVTHVSASMDTGVFTLTEKGWQLARADQPKIPARVIGSPYSAPLLRMAATLPPPACWLEAYRP